MSVLSALYKVRVKVKVKLVDMQDIVGVADMCNSGGSIHLSSWKPLFEIDFF